MCIISCFNCLLFISCFCFTFNYRCLNTIAKQETDKQSSKVTSENTKTKSEIDKRLVSGSIPNKTMPSKEDIVKN